MKIIIAISILFLLSSCNKIDFQYDGKKNLVNPIYQKTDVKTSGVDLPFIKSYIPSYFGINNDNEFVLSIKINQKTVKRSIETNQAASNIRYELRFLYSLISNELNCTTFEKEIVSSFSIIPKSSGYNYGADASLEKNYELSVIENLNEFISFLNGADLNSCK